MRGGSENCLAGEIGILHGKVEGEKGRGGGERLGRMEKGIGHV